MREKLNENPIAQVALIGVLLVVVAFLFMTRMGGSGSSSSAEDSTAAPPAPGATAAPAPGVPATGAPAATVPTTAPVVTPPPLPPRFAAAVADGGIVALLVLRGGGVDDAAVADVVRGLSGPGLSTFVVRAEDVADYAAVTQGVQLDRVPALLTLAPSPNGPPEASVSYGFRSIESAVQAIRDAAFEGRPATYNPK